MSNSLSHSYLPPLFDRLQKESVSALSWDDYIESIRREIETMLSTRFAFKAASMLDISPEKKPLKSYAYLLPDALGWADFSDFDFNSPSQKESFAH